MAIEFARSDRSTLGIEWELALVDRHTGDLVGAAPEVLANTVLTDEDGNERITSELLTNTVEVVTGVNRTVAEGVADLEHTIERLRRTTDPMGLELIGSGTHPFARWQDQQVTDKERYVTLVDRTGVFGRQLLIWGVHNHIGVDDPAKALPVLEAMLVYYPHLQALSASSPFVFGESSGYASSRAMLFQQLPTAGLPPQLESWQQYESIVADLIHIGVIDHWDEIRWDVRPSAKWGTVETRVSDGLPTILEIGAVSALTQCLVDDFSERLDAGEELRTLQPWFVRENKWRAARYGMDAEVVVDRGGSERLVEDDLRDLVTRLEPVAERLGCATELHDVLTIIDVGASYERQALASAQAGGDLRAVVSSLVREMREGRPHAG
ncbi:glutamate--cysteine ligase [Amnibacterium kyonggiense]|uniref:Putative glutamate--cysteine ligase 2 n=1 Tax=Amnibacterium kyonggiense TaxID=595671 RepID=A0A4R7FT39_9MICO|nr:glutamate--cysteine ligase [Amnibacterium kyonggiense]TDS80948.1 carboxylate-amine ligase [Amnibacterium kyonggiense]